MIAVVESRSVGVKIKLIFIIKLTFSKDFFTSPKTTYLKTSKEARGSYFFLKLTMQVLLEIKLFYLLKFEIIAGLIRIRVSLEGGPYYKFYGS